MFPVVTQNQKETKGRQPRRQRERAPRAMCILRANIGMNTFTAEEPGPQKANPSSVLAQEINSALCIFPPKNVKKASLDILKAQSPALSSLHTHGASSTAHRDMIPGTQKTGFCQGEGQALRTVYGETCFPPGYQPHRHSLSPW